LPRLQRCDFDQAYIERLIAEDPTTERHFSQYFGELIALKLRSRLRSPALVEDTRQETFARVLATLKQKGGLDAAENLGGFVNAVCNHVLFEMYRSASRTSQLPEDYDTADRTSNAEAAIVAGEQRTRVRRALAALPQRERDLLTWLFFEGRDKDAICRDLHVDRNHLRVMLHRAKARFRETLARGDTE